MAASKVSPIQNFGFVILAAFLFMIFSRIFEVTFDNLHVPGISYRVMAVVVLVTGSFAPVFRSQIGKYFLGFTACLVLATAFSSWHTGSLEILTGSWLMSTVVFVATAGLISSFKQYRQAITSLSFAVFVFALICLKLGDMSTGRLFLETGRFSNPNEMAQALLLGLPFWMAFASRSSALGKKLFGGAVVLLMLYLISKTGSRGALICFFLLYFVLIHHASLVGKIRLLVLGALIVCAAVALLPSSLKDRYQTMFSESPQQLDLSSDPDMLDKAVSSTQSREYLLKQSLKVTLHHPLFGVGPGNFVVEEDRLARAEGKRKGSWLGTHNSYTQISSECGIPAFFFYVATLLLSLKATRRLYKEAKGRPELKDVASQAEALYFSLLCLAVTAFFVHAAYTALMPVLTGFTVALMRVTKSMLASTPEAAPAVAAPSFPAAYRLPVPARTT